MDDFRVSQPQVRNDSTELDGMSSSPCDFGVAASQSALHQPCRPQSLSKRR